MQPRLTLKSNERVLLCGKTGSGKTTLARGLVASIERLVVLDPKSNMYGAEWQLEAWSKDVVKRLENGEPARARIVAPDDPEGWEEYLGILYGIGDLTIYIDEVYGLEVTATRYGRWLRALYTRGRELGLGVWAATQRPRNIPPIMVSEAEWYFCFYLAKKEDRQYMAGFMGDEVKEPPKDKYGFWFANGNWRKPLYCPGIQI